ncbi:YegP family protein [Pedobacter nototheniae]|nr:DUF1508 domain-containing protein [Pedobacter nototheniae]
MGKFIITKRTNGEYQFNLKASNGQVILTSEGYGVIIIENPMQISLQYGK